jgi:hypothetical protein
MTMTQEKQSFAAIQFDRAAEESATGVPAHTLSGLRSYVVDRVPTGGFLTAVLTNDLKLAVARADSMNARALREIVMFCYSALPGNSWGSRERYDAWLERTDG